MNPNTCQCVLCHSLPPLSNVNRSAQWNVNAAVSSTHLSALIVIMGGAAIPTVSIPTVGNGAVIGTLANAEQAQLIHNASGGYGGNGNYPANWSYLGGGMSRSVYQGPDGIAYKVQRNEAYCNGGNGANQSEADTFASLSPLLPPHIKLAPCTVWTDTVSAMVNCGDGNNVFDYALMARYVAEAKRISAATDTPLRDLHGGNVRPLHDDNGDMVLWLIDYAF